MVPTSTYSKRTEATESGGVTEACGRLHETGRLKKSGVGGREEERRRRKRRFPGEKEGCVGRE